MYLFKYDEFRLKKRFRSEIRDISTNVIVRLLRPLRILDRVPFTELIK